MTANEVIQLGENISPNKEPYFIWFFVFMGLSILLLVLIARFAKKNPDKDDKFIYLGGMYLLTVMSMMIMLFVGASQHSKNVEVWENEIAQPYINSLEEQKESIMGIDFVRTRYGKLVTIIIKDGDSYKEYTGNYVIKTTLPSGAKPYVGYKYLEQDLGYDIEKGYYDITVYVPQDYNF